MAWTVLASADVASSAAEAFGANVVVVGDRRELADAARRASTAHVVVMESGVRPRAGAANGLAGALGEALVVGGRSVRGHEDHYGWMLAPARFGVVPFEPTPIVTPTAERGAADLVRGEIDAASPGLLVADRALLLEPLPDDPLAAMIELGARARERGGRVVCRPAFAYDAPRFDADDRGSAAALAALARARPALRGVHRDVAAVRRRGIVRETRLGGGGRALVRRPLPPVTILTHGARAAAKAPAAVTPALARHAHVAEPAAALARELERRGDRYVLVAEGSRLPAPDAFDALVERLEASEHVAAVAPDAASLSGACVLLAVSRLPQHVVPAGDTLGAALATLYAAARDCGRIVLPAAPGVVTPPRRALSVEAVFLTGSKPEVTRNALDALLTTAGDARIVGVVSAAAETRATLLRSYPTIETIEDPGDPLLGAALSVALGEVRSDLVFVCADDVLPPPETVAALAATFARIPALGAAFPRANGTGAQEELHEVTYRSLEEMKQFAAARLEAFARDTERIDDAAIPAFVASVAALRAVGGIDEKLGPTRWGIADLVLRLRAGGYDVVRCDDVYVHRFSVAESANPAAIPAPAVEREFRRRWGLPQLGPFGERERAAAIAAGFDAGRHAGFRGRGTLAAAAVAAPRIVVAVPVGDEAELQRAEAFLRRAIPALDAGDRVDVAVLLDGDVAPADVTARLRALFASDPRPLEQTPNVRVLRADSSSWPPPDGVRLFVAAGHEREDLPGAERIDGSRIATLKHAAR